MCFLAETATGLDAVWAALMNLLLGGVWTLLCVALGIWIGRKGFTVADLEKVLEIDLNRDGTVGEVVEEPADDEA